MPAIIQFVGSAPDLYNSGGLSERHYTIVEPKDMLRISLSEYHQSVAEMDYAQEEASGHRDLEQYIIVVYVDDKEVDSVLTEVYYGESNQKSELYYNIIGLLPEGHDSADIDQETLARIYTAIEKHSRGGVSIREAIIRANLARATNAAIAAGSFKANADPVNNEDGVSSVFNLGAGR